MPLRANEVTGHLEFRISGQAEKFFGDGLAIWIAKNGILKHQTASGFQFGKFHGYPEAFQGIGIIIDTFRNTEFVHKDIAIVINDGTKDRDKMMATVLGCDADVRYHDKRADFDPSQTSTLRFTVRSQKGEPSELGVWVDARSTGDYEPCATVALQGEGLPPDWLREGHVTVTATTGQLADNHDVVALALTDQADDEFQTESKLKYATSVVDSTIAHDDHAGRLAGLEAALALALAKLQHLDHDLDHRFAALDDHVQSSAQKLRDQEQKLEQRVVVLEEELLDNIEGQLEARVENLERKVRQLVDTKIESSEAKLGKDIKKSVKRDLRKSMGRWKLPFLLLAVTMVGAGVAFWRWYNKLKKTHLL